MITHGHTVGGVASPTYRVWHGVLQRCLCPTDTAYASYGGRGVKVCDRWNPSAGGSFQNFLDDMGERPPDKSLDKDIHGDGMLYSRETCCWATKAEQSRATRRTRLFTFEGRTQCYQDWAIELGISWTTIAYRVESGWPPERIVQPSTLPRRMLTWNGRTQTLTAWALELGVQSQLIHYRLKQGWSVDHALGTPPRSKPGC